jgi:hypothetical protein
MLASYISTGHLSSANDAASVLIANSQRGVVTDAKSTNNHLTSTQKEFNLAAPTIADAISVITTQSDLTAPSVPRAFSIKYNRLSWQAPEKFGGYGELTYIVQQQVGSAWQNIGSTVETSFKLNAKDTSSVSVYRVFASNPSGVSAPTGSLRNIGAESSALIAPIADLPTELAGSVRAVQAGVRSSVVYLSWEAVPDSLQYSVEIAPAGTDHWKLARITKNSEAMVTQTPGRRVLVRVTSTTASGVKIVVGTIQYNGMR